MATKKSEAEGVAQEIEALRSLKRQLMAEIRDRNPFAKDEEPDETKTKRYLQLVDRHRRVVAQEAKVWDNLPTVDEE